MRISFLVNHVQNGWEPTDTRLGGTERGVVEWAEELVRRGYRARIFRNGHADDDFPYINGVHYYPRQHYVGGGDICINIKSSEVEPKEPTIYYTNETNATDLDLSKYLGVIHISNWAKEHIPVNNPTVFVVPHGYDDSKIFPVKKIPKQCFYASSPDRGLDTLLDAWPKVYEAHPDATLLLTYGVTDVDLPGVTCVGDVDENTMNEIYKTSDIWCHPANGGELQCITGLKAQAAGCWPVIIPTMALSETVKYGTFSSKEEYADDLISALTHHPKPPKLHHITIKESTDKLLGVIQFLLGKRDQHERNKHSATDRPTRTSRTA